MKDCKEVGGVFKPHFVGSLKPLATDHYAGGLPNRVKKNLANLIRSKSLVTSRRVRLNRYVDSIIIMPVKKVSTITLPVQKLNKNDDLIISKVWSLSILSVTHSLVICLQDFTLPVELSNHKRWSQPPTKVSVQFQNAKWDCWQTSSETGENGWWQVLSSQWSPFLTRHGSSSSTGSLVRGFPTSAVVVEQLKILRNEHPYIVGMFNLSNSLGD